jgi:DNA invertase Pin-like site-specific DNA recombinase
MSQTDDNNRNETGHKIGYARVSTEDQDLTLQRDALIRAGVDPLDIYEDKATGKHMNRPGWQALMKDAREGDTVIIWKLDRMGRNLVELVRTADDMRKRGVELRSLDSWIDTRTPVGRAMFQLMGVFAELEASMISERTKAGLAVARARGRIGGRRRLITDEEVREVHARVQAGEFLKDIVKERKPPVTAQAFYNRFKELGL